MKWTRAYCQTAYCTKCWYRWIITEIRGFDEDDPLKCPNCKAPDSRIYWAGDIDGDGYKELDREEKKKEQERKKSDDEKE